MVRHRMTSAFLDDEISHAMPDVRQAWERPRSRLRLSVAAAELRDEIFLGLYYPLYELGMFRIITIHELGKSVLNPRHSF